MKRFTIWSLFCSALLMACSAPETMSELDRVEKAFGDQIGGDVDPLHLWRTAVTLKVNVESTSPVKIWALSSGTEDVTLYDKTELEGSGVSFLTLPQGLGTEIEIIAVSGTNRIKKNLSLMSLSDYEIDLIFEDNHSRSANNSILYGNSVLQNNRYEEISLNTWQNVMQLISAESLDQSTRGEIVNYELVSKGPFEITFIAGFGNSFDPHMLGYYFHTPNTYSDIRFVDIAETHIYDYLDGMAKVQYMLSDSFEAYNTILYPDQWYDANFDAHDDPEGLSYPNIPRRDDDAFNAILVWKTMGNIVSKFRGITFEIDVPEGMHLGFYLRMDKERSPSQLNHVTKLGIPEYAFPTAFSAYNFSAQAFNYSSTGKKTHRSWIHEFPEFTFMGMEDIFNGGDLDCNDVVFGMTANGMEMVMPEVIIPDIDYMTAEYQTLPWTIGYEDVHRNADYDFNDAVIRLEPDFDNDQIDVQVLAAGSDQKMWLHYDGPNGDINLGEIHQLLDRRINDDATELPFINTKSSLMNYPGVSVGKLPWPKDYTMAKDAERFYIEVKRGTCTDCTDIIKLPSQPGLTPEAVLVAGEWKWPKEGISITETYSVFPDWCADMTRTVFWPWHNYPKNNTFVSNGL